MNECILVPAPSQNTPLSKTLVEKFEWEIAFKAIEDSNCKNSWNSNVKGGLAKGWIIEATTAGKKLAKDLNEMIKTAQAEKQPIEATDDVFGQQ